jgi:arabinose-5-phosphate isomerase
MQKQEILTLARDVLAIESNAIASLCPAINDDFYESIQLILNCQGRVIVTGMGKSGHIAGKIAATLASTGTPSFFVHPGEASHGDLGMITKDDTVIALSYSGETEELLALLPLLKRFGIHLISITGNSSSTLALQSNYHLSVQIEKEACPLGLAPTSSTTATLAMGDAIAVAALQARGFTAEAFALSHPGGTLGKRLLLTVGNLMHTKESVPAINQNSNISAAIEEMSQKGFGVTSVHDDEQKLLGVFTDGDIRRAITHQIDIQNTATKEVMTSSGVTVKKELLAAEALKLMEENKITSLFVVDDNDTAIGILHMHDLLKSAIA